MPRIILYNGSSGGIGRFMAGELAQQGLPGHILASRLEDREGLVGELQTLADGDRATLVHLAARVSVPACEADPGGAYDTNLVGTLQTVDEFIRWSSGRQSTARVVFVSTGHVYRAREPGHKVAETDELQPRSVYAHSKLATERSLIYLSERHGFELVIVRVFGVLAPGQPDQYVLPGLLRRLEAGELDDIPGLDFSRDYLDARDVCAALSQLATIALPTRVLTINVCSGFPTTIRDLLISAAAVVRPDIDEGVLVRLSPRPGRVDDVPWLVGDAANFQEVVGRPAQRRTIDQAVADAARARSERVGRAL